MAVVRFMRRRHAAPADADHREIPPDVLFEILVRFPVMDVGRMTSLCRFWRSFIRDPCFIEEHHRRSAAGSDYLPRVIVFLRNTDGSRGRGMLISFSPHAAAATGEVTSSSRILRLPRGQEYHLTASSKGLLSFYDRDGGALVVNPITGERPRFPNPSPGTPLGDSPSICGIGYEPDSKKYKIVRIYKACFREEIYNVELHTLGSGGSWKQLCSVNGIGPLPATVVTVAGVMYWGINKLGKILSIDLRQERASFIGFPVGGEDYLLGELEGHLTFTEKSNVNGWIFIWFRVKRDRTREYVWQSRYKLPVIEAIRRGGGGAPGWAAPMALYEARFMLVRIPTGLGFFDLQSGRFREVFRHEGMEGALVHENSLASIAHEVRPAVNETKERVLRPDLLVRKYRVELSNFFFFFALHIGVGLLVFYGAFEW